MAKYEIYESIEGRKKTYLVADVNYLNLKGCFDHQKLEDFISYSMRYFKVKSNRLFMTSVWVVGDEMYLENPHKRGSKQLTAICVINKKLPSKCTNEVNI